ncbi:MAG: Peptidase [Planctomycetota bacterium]|nr:Peptidase [Planctomycetota bacterium]
MTWSWRLGRIAGIDVYVHATFLLLLAWEVMAGLQAHSDAGEMLGGLGFILVLFGIVVLHELGHAMAARSYGIHTRDITLLPIGGVARLEWVPRDPGPELVIALAGPAVNLVLAAVIYLVMALGRGPSPFGEALHAGGILDRLFWVNVSLAVFNLLPAFPMDGGRVLRAVLAIRMDYNRATRVAASIGQGLAILFAILGFFYDPLLIIIALFVWLGAAEAAGQAQAGLRADGNLRGRHGVGPGRP